MMLTCTRHRRGPSRAFVIVYALGALALVGALAMLMVNASGSENLLIKRRMYTQLARSAAESGVEYGLALINHELADPNGPYYDVNYDADPDNASQYRWMKAPDLMAAGITDPTKIEWAYRTTTVHAGTDSNPSVFRYATQMQLVLWPTLNYGNVTNPATLFHIRSRGEAIEDQSAGKLQPVVIATETVIQSFQVPGLDKNCSLPTLVRVLWEPKTDSNMGPIPWMQH